MKVRAKICGIKSERDLKIAMKSGADAIGLISGITHTSEDNLANDTARRLAMHVPPYISTVLVTHIQDASMIIERASSIGVDTIQIHGLITPQTAEEVRRRWRGRITRAVHVTGEGAIERALMAASVSDAIHLDSRTTDRLGGTGKTHDWSVSAEIVRKLRELNKPCILAGGLTAENVKLAIAQVGPYAVDVNSGVEDSRGNKDSELVRSFVRAAHSGNTKTFYR